MRVVVQVTLVAATVVCATKMVTPGDEATQIVALLGFVFGVASTIDSVNSYVRQRQEAKRCRSHP